jgi:hypothetical protein
MPFGFPDIGVILNTAGIGCRENGEKSIEWGVFYEAALGSLAGFWKVQFLDGRGLG